MTQKTFRYLTLAPIILSLLSLLHRYASADSILGQLAMSNATIFGLVLMSVVWFVYFSGYRYGKHLLLGEGVAGFALTSWILLAHHLRINNSLERLFVSSSSPFLLNLAYMFLAGYLIAALYFWLHRTKLPINICLALILFMSLLSIFGHIYALRGIGAESLLLPMPLGALLSYCALALVIYVHTNSMEHLYLNGRIVVSFVTMLIAVIGANVVVYSSLNKTTDSSSQIEITRHILTETYNVDLYLDSAQSAAQAYEASGNSVYILSYHSNRQAYLQAITTLKQQARQSSEASTTYSSIQTVSTLGDHVLGLAETAIAEKQPLAATSTATRNTRDIAMDMYMNQVLGEMQAVNLAYTNQLNQLTKEQTLGNRGIVLGVSITSALSLILFTFTPLFIRQTIQSLEMAQEQLEDSNKLLSEEKSRAEAVLVSIGDGLFAVDLQGTVTIFNHVAETITGIRRDAVLGRNYSDVLKFTSLTDPAAQLDFTDKALRGTASHLSHNAVLRRAGGRTLDVQVSAAPIKNRVGSIIGAIIVFRDRSEEQALENAKDEFLSLASHQLRTPATATKQFLAMFLQGYAGTIDDKQRLYLEQAYENNELGIKIIEDLLNITRLESNRWKITKERIELGAFLKTVAEQHKEFADKSKQTIRLITSTKPLCIDADPTLLGMALDNLIMNALKYSDTGDTVTIRLGGGKHAAITISDQGIGIKKEDIPRLFERFTRLEDPQKQYVSGTGIGLYLVKKIIKKLHATIKVESEYGKGSTFTLEFKPLE